MTNDGTVSLDALLLQARTFKAFEDREIDDHLLMRIYDLAKFGPTSFNLCPMRIVFAQSPKAKAKIEQALSPGNVEQTRTEPVTAIMAFDMKFYDHASVLAPPMENPERMALMPEAALETMALRNTSLQAGYFILAARSCGLDGRPMSGFNQTKIDELFFSGTSLKSNFRMNLGYGIRDNLKPRWPRLSFADAYRIERSISQCLCITCEVAAS